MLTFLETILSGLILLAVGGTAFLAWHDPRVYRAVAPWAIFGTYGLAILAMGYYFGRQHGFFFVLAQVRELNPGVIVEAPIYDEMGLVWAGGTSIVVSIYLFLLWGMADARSPRAPSKPEPREDGGEGK